MAVRRQNFSNLASLDVDAQETSDGAADQGEDQMEEVENSNLQDQSDKSACAEPENRPVAMKKPKAKARSK